MKAQAVRPRSFTLAHSGLIQRKCACGATTGFAGECSDCGDKKLSLQRSPASPNGHPEIPHAVRQTLSEPGQPLKSETLDFMESRFGHDFSNVRVHDDPKAYESAKAVDARAFTLGSDIVFGAGEYAPGTAEGQKLLAHELTHVVQQAGTVSLSSSIVEVSSPTDALEQEAERASHQVMANGGTQVVAPLSGITRAPASGMPRLARATYNIGPLAVRVNYGDIIYIPESEYESAIETRFEDWAGGAASTIHTELTALTADQKRWVLFSLDVLVDNTTPSHSIVNRIQGVHRLIAHAPNAAHQPLSGATQEYLNELLRASGWLEVGLADSLTAPSWLTKVIIKDLYNPPSKPGEDLDVKCLTNKLNVYVPIFLDLDDTASGTSKGTQAIAPLQAIGDQIQTEARSFFAPYSDAALGNIYTSNWLYSANIFDVATIVPDESKRINFLLNRAVYVGNHPLLDPTIFTECKYDSRNDAHRAELKKIVTLMARAPNIQPIVDRLIRSTGRTEFVPSMRVGIDTGFNQARTTECEARWNSIQTLCHELLHAMVQPKFMAAITGINSKQIVQEGFAEVLGVQLFESLRAKADNDPAFKSKMEAGINTAPCEAPNAATVGYGQAGKDAATIRRLVGDDKFRAAYFLGAKHLVALR